MIRDKLSRLRVHNARPIGVSLCVWMGVISLASILMGCSSSKWAGNYKGLLKEVAGKKPTKKIGFSETKPILTSTLTLSGDGSYIGKFREVEYSGDWKESSGKVTLTPKTYMGMTQENFPKTKKDTDAGAVDSLFKPYELEEGSDGKTLVHTDDAGTNTFTKAD